MQNNFKVFHFPFAFFIFWCHKSRHEKIHGSCMPKTNSSHRKIKNKWKICCCCLTICYFGGSSMVAIDWSSSSMIKLTAAGPWAYLNPCAINPWRSVSILYIEIGIHISRVSGRLVGEVGVRIWWDIFLLGGNWEHPSQVGQPGSGSFQFLQFCP